MKNIIDNVADRLILFTTILNKANDGFAAFLKKGNNGIAVAAIFFGSISLLLAHSLYDGYGNLWLASVPVVLFVLTLFSVLIANSYRNGLKKQSRVSPMKLVGFNMDFNERILRRIYVSLTRYEYLDENLTSFQDFYNVLVLDFDEHHSALHFICTQPQLKYILKKLKQLKNGISYVSFERSEKIYHKGNLISIEVLHKKCDEFPPNYEFEQRVDSVFKFLGDI